MNIAVFGGSFDPPHKGHQEIVKEALKTLHVERVFVTPTYLNPFKKESFAPSLTRFNWLQKLFTCRDVEVVDFECRQNRAVSTIKTVEYLKSIYDLDKIYLIVGADHLSTIPKWERYSELKSMVEFVIASRDGTILPKELKKLSINVKISSSKLRSDMDLSFIPEIIKDEVEEFYKDKNEK